MRLLDDIECMVRCHPQRLPQLSSTGASFRDIVHIGSHRSHLLPDYIEAAGRSTDDDEWLDQQIDALLRKKEVRQHPQACSALIRVHEQRFPGRRGELVAQILYDTLRTGGEVNDALLDMLVVDCNLVHRNDLCQAKGETWNGPRALIQALRNLGMLARSAPDRSTWDGHFTRGVAILDKMVGAGANLEEHTRVVKHDSPQEFHGLLHRACHDHDKNPPNDLPIAVLMECGADWESVLHKGLASDSARELIETHPRVRRQRLVDASGRDGQDTDRSPLRM